MESSLSGSQKQYCKIILRFLFSRLPVFRSGATNIAKCLTRPVILLYFTTWTARAKMGSTVASWREGSLQTKWHNLVIRLALGSSVLWAAPDTQDRGRCCCPPVPPPLGITTPRYDLKLTLEDVRLSTEQQNKILESRTAAWEMVKLSRAFLLKGFEEKRKKKKLFFSLTKRRLWKDGTLFIWSKDTDKQTIHPPTNIDVLGMKSWDL